MSEQGIDIDAASPAGAFYGTRTLRQLLPPDLLRAAPVQAPRCPAAWFAWAP